MVFFLPRLVFLIAVLFAVVLIVKVYIITNVDIREAEANILINRLLYSKNGLSHYDESIKRVYPGVIDLDKFKQLSMNNPNALDSVVINYGSDNPIIAAKITLRGIDTYKGDPEIIVYYNKDRFDKWEPRTLSSIRGGAGTVKAFKEQNYVLAKEGDVVTPKILEFYIIS